MQNLYQFVFQKFDSAYLLLSQTTMIDDQQLRLANWFGTFCLVLEVFYDRDLVKSNLNQYNLNCIKIDHRLGVN